MPVIIRSLPPVLAALALSTVLSGCGHTTQQRAATGAATGAVVGGPVGAAVGGAVGTGISKARGE